MKLKIGDRVVEKDDIITLVYKIIDIKKGVAIGAIDFEGKRYFTSYRVKYKDPKNIQPLNPTPGDLTLRYLAKRNEHIEES